MVAPDPMWAPYAAAAGGVVLLAGYGTVTYRLGQRRARSRARLPAAKGEKTTAPQTSRWDLAAAGIATMVSAEGMWETFGSMGMPIPLRLATFAFIEIAVVASARRARRSMVEKFRAGVDGIAMWVLTVLSAVLSAAHEVDKADSNPAIVLIRLVAPLVAAWGWERNMALERRRRGLPSGINWRVTPERVLVRVGLAEATDRTTGDVDNHRRITRVARAAKKLRTLEASKARKGRLSRARARLDRAMDAAVEHTGLADDSALQTELMREIGALYNTGSLAELNAPAWWTPTVADRGVICRGRNAPAGMVALRVREPGRGFRVLHPAPRTGVHTEAVSRTAASLMERLRQDRTERRTGVQPVQPLPRTARTLGPRTGADRTGPYATPYETVRALLPGPVMLRRTPPVRPVRLTPARTEPAPRTGGAAHAEPVRLAPVQEPYGHTNQPVRPVRDTIPGTTPAQQARPRTATAPTRTDRPVQVTAPVHDRTDNPARTPVREDRTKAEWIEHLAHEIRTAEDEDRTWKPNYEDLMPRTGFKLAWCEKVVRAARTRAEQLRTANGTTRTEAS